MAPALVTNEWTTDFSPALEHVSFPQAIDARFPLGYTTSAENYSKSRSA